MKVSLTLEESREAAEFTQRRLKYINKFTKLEIMKLDILVVN